MLRGVGRVAPGGRLLGGHAHRAGGFGMAFTRFGGGLQVVRRHQVGEDVVPHDGGVLVGTGDTVEVPNPVPVMVSKRVPQSCRLDEHGQAALGFQRIIARDNAIALERHGDVGVDVPRRACPPASTPSTLRRGWCATGRPRRRGRVTRLGPWRGPRWRPAIAAHRRPQWVPCKSAPAARNPRCPRRHARRSRCR